MNIFNIIEYSCDILKKAKIENARMESKLIIRKVLNLESNCILNEDEKISEEKISKILDKIKRRSKGEPLAYISGYKPFFKINVLVNKNVLIPRPETEHLVETVLNNIKNLNHKYEIIDIGVGSGAILCSLLLEMKNSFGIGTDISKKAIEVSNKNVKKYKLENRCSLVNTNWAQSLKNDKFDILTCNPPYIDKKELLTLEKGIISYEPLTALDGGLNGLESLKSLLPSARNCLKPQGKAFFEIGYNQSKEAKDIIEKNNFKISDIIKDLAGIERVIFATAA